MSNKTIGDGSTRSEALYRLVFILSILIVAFKALSVWLSGDPVFQESGNDDIMRLMSVRDWRAGQHWYDMTQYRIQPDEGVSLHWSRYLDVGIGALVSFFDLFVPIETAEELAGYFWPLLLTILLIWIVGQMTYRLLGPTAAATAVLMIICYPPIAFGYFGSGKLDHHNLQITLMAFAVLALARADNPRLFGCLSGLAAAFSLAIGLETLFIVAALSFLHLCDAATSREGARARLFSYCAALALGSLLLFLGQTAPAEWQVPQCDELSPPYLAIAWIGAVGCSVGLAVTRKRKSVVLLFASVAAVTLLGSIVFWSLIGPCVQSPYGHLPQETQTFIATQILEAQSVLATIQVNPLMGLSYLGPALAVVLLSSMRWWSTREKEQGRPGVGYLIVIGWLGIFACFWQVRQVVILAVVTPTLTGYVLAPFLERRRVQRDRESLLALFGVALATILQPGLISSGYQFVSRFHADVNVSQRADRVQESDCMDPTKLAVLNDAEPMRVLTGLNLGPLLIMATHHDTFSAPYHRSNAALTSPNFLGLEHMANFEKALEELGADAVLVCKETTYVQSESIATKLAQGETFEGLSQVPVADDDLLLFKLGNDT